MPTQNIPNLIQGVSQQSPQQRRDTQCEDQYDCINSVTQGCAARPPTEVVKVWAGRDLSGAFLEEFVRGSEDYLLGVEAETPFAINLDTGVDATITGAAYPNVTGYLNDVVGVAERDQFRVQAVEDTIFLLNRYKAPAMAATKSTALPYEAMVWVRSQIRGEHTLFLTGPASLTAVAGGIGFDTTTFDMVDDFKTDIDTVSGYRAAKSGSLLKVDRTGGADFNIRGQDPSGDTIMSVFKDYITDISKLPQRGFTGFRVRVRGEDKTIVDDYWLEFQGDPGTGTWNEVVAPDTFTTIDPNTMPHTLIWTATNTFSFVKKDWSTRIAGDANTAKDPGFIGKFCRDMYYHKNRLGFLYAGGAVWSKARFPYTYFPDTLQAVLDTAPVDVTLAAAQGASRGSVNMDFSVQIDGTFSFWAPGAQFEVTNGQDNFKQGSVSANPSTAYEYSLAARPMVLNKYLHWASEAGDWATMWAVQYQQGKAGGETEVAAHVPNYINSGVRRLAGSPTLNMAFVATDGDPDALFLWNFLNLQQEYVQSAWNRWRLPGGTVLWAGIKSNYLRILQQRPEGVALLSVNLTPKVKDAITGATYLTRLDMRVTQAQVTSLAYNSGTGRTSFTLPYTPTGSALKVVMAETSGDLFRGKELTVVSVVGAVVTVTGDLSGGKKFYAGQVISAERTESTFYLRSDKGVTPLDRLTVDRFGIEYADTGYTRIEVYRPNATEPYKYAFEGRQSGLPVVSGMETPVLAKGNLDAAVGELNSQATIRIVNDSWLPSYWVSADYGYTAIGKAAQK